MFIFAVAPLAGAWIEILGGRLPLRLKMVAPLAGAWIEMDNEYTYTISELVAPLAGAWIEIAVSARGSTLCASRSPCGSVD